MTRSRLIKKPSKLGLFIVVNVGILFFLIIGFGREYVSNLQIEREISELERERERLETEKLNTLDLIEELSSEYYLEREARTNHGLGEPGETLIVIQDQGSRDLEASDKEDEDQALRQTENPARWFNYFFDKETFEKLNAL
ncbi:septum formation initiator family protein [Patescibacteria group bacterium]|nr:septum formation initiator family protein [Patescibacteria group bacterium]